MLHRKLTCRENPHVVTLVLSKKSINQFWQIHVTTHRNPCIDFNNFDKNWQRGVSHWWTNKARQWLDLGPIKNTKCVVLQTLWWDEMSINTFIIPGNSYLQWWMSKLLIKLVQGGFSYQRRWLSVWRALRDTCCGKYNWGFGISFPYCHYDSYCVQNVLSSVFFPWKRAK